MSTNKTTILHRPPNPSLGEKEDDYTEEKRSIPPDGGTFFAFYCFLSFFNFIFQFSGWGWIIVLSGFFVHLLCDGVIYAFGVILDVLMDVFEANATQVSFVGSLLPAIILGVGKRQSVFLAVFIKK